MPVYEYTAINANGKSVKGRIDADSLRGVQSRLQKQKLYPTSITEASAATSKERRISVSFLKQERVKPQELAVATRQLSTLVGAGLPLVSALQALAEQTDSLTLQRILVDVREEVEEGAALAKSLGRHPKIFPRLYVNLVAAGEASGTLDQVLETLADHLEASMALRRKVVSALTYPAVMLVICMLVLVGLLVGVIPRIVEMFTKNGTPLPLPTRIVLAMSESLIHYWWLYIFLIAASTFALLHYYRTTTGRSQIDRLLLRLPGFGSLYVKTITARVASTLSTLVASGVELLRALDITKNVVGNVHVVKVLEEARDGVKEGKSLAKELLRDSIFPTMLSRMVAVGEKSGALEKMLSKAASAYDTEVKAALDGITSLINPLLVVVVGGIVLFVVFSVLLPMVELTNVVAV